MGAANVAAYRLLRRAGIDPARVIACDSEGTLHAGRADIEKSQREFTEKWQVCIETNPDRVAGGVDAALRGADVCIALSASGPGVIHPTWIEAMAKDAIVFACANPVPEIWPWEAQAAGARIVGTGRGDYPNQVNNSLAFPSIFRGTLDVRARTITDGMALSAANELARFAEERGIHPNKILPRMDEWEVFPRVATAVALKAQEEGVARLRRSREQLQTETTRVIRQAQDLTRVLMQAGSISSPSSP
jgi:malate dehydrogenase (oxaloacetate-decarboxylating)